MLVDVPNEMYGGDPAGLLRHLGLEVARRPAGRGATFEVALARRDLVTFTTLRGPALRRSRFDLLSIPVPGVPGGMGPDLAREFDRIVADLESRATLPALFDRVAYQIVVVPDSEVPAAIRWGSDVLGSVPLVNSDGHEESLFPHHSVHDIRIDALTYRWSKLPQVFLRLQRHTAEQIIEANRTDPDRLAFESSGALLEGSVFGGLYFAPLLGSLTPRMWGFAAPRLGQVVVYTLGREVPGLGKGLSYNCIDSLRLLAPHSASDEFNTTEPPPEMHRAAYSDAVEWWAFRLNKLVFDLYAPTTYVDATDRYTPVVHHRWMLNLEQLLHRVAAIGRQPGDPGTQLMIMFSAMDLLGDSFYGNGNIGQLFRPSNLARRVARIEERLPDRIRPLILVSAQRALVAAERIADEFFIDSADPDATPDSRIEHLMNARRNATHGFSKNTGILSEHTGRLPKDIVLIPMVYLLDIMTDHQNLLGRIQRECRDTASSDRNG